MAAAPRPSRKQRTAVRSLQNTPIADLLDAMKAFAAIARLLAGYREAMVKEGFTRREAMWLTGLYQQHMHGVSKPPADPTSNVPTGQYL